MGTDLDVEHGGDLIDLLHLEVGDVLLVAGSVVDLPGLLLGMCYSVEIVLVNGGVGAIEVDVVDIRVVECGKVVIVIGVEELGTIVIEALDGGDGLVVRRSHLNIGRDALIVGGGHGGSWWLGRMTAVGWRGVAVAGGGETGRQRPGTRRGVTRLVALPS